MAGNAYAALTGGRIDAVAYVLAGYTVLMVLVQLRLLPLYRALPFAPSFWSFTFPYAAVAVDAMSWIQVERPAGERLLGCAVLGALTVLIGGIGFFAWDSYNAGSYERMIAAVAAIGGVGLALDRGFNALYERFDYQGEKR